MESTDKSPDLSEPQEVTNREKDSANDGKGAEKDVGSGDKDAPSLEENPELSNVDSGDKEEQSSTKKSPQNDPQEKSPELSAEKSNDSVEESNPAENPSVVTDKDKVSTEHTMVSESEVVALESIVSDETKSSEKDPLPDCPPVSNKKDDAALNLEEKEDSSESEAGIRPGTDIEVGESKQVESEPEKVEVESEKVEGESEKVEGESEKVEGESEKVEGESEKVEGEDTKEDTNEISQEDFGSAKQQPSPSSKENISVEAENIDAAEDSLTNQQKSPEEQESIDQSPNMETSEKSGESAQVEQESTEATAEEPMDVDDEKGPDKPPSETEEVSHAMATADVDNESRDELMEVSTHEDENDPLSSADKEKDVETSTNEDLNQEKNRGCEVEIHTDIVKDEQFNVEDDSGDGEKSNDSSAKDKERNKVDSGDGGISNDSVEKDKDTCKEDLEGGRKSGDSTEKDKEVSKDGLDDGLKSNDTARKDHETSSNSPKEAPDKPPEEGENKTEDTAKTAVQDATAKEVDDEVCIIPDSVPEPVSDNKKDTAEKEAPATSPTKVQTSETTSDDIEEIGEVVEVKGTRKERRKYRTSLEMSMSPSVDLTAPRPQRQAAKKAESQIKVLAAVESYEPPPDPKPKLTILDRVTEANPCQQCGLVTFCKYQMQSKDSFFYFCRELCYNEYQSPNETPVPIISDSASPPPPVSVAELERPFERTCSKCSAKINATDERVLTWETMDFCSDDCLGKYQTALGSHCANCKGAVQNSSLGKYCVRFGYNIKQFCCAGCLEEFKKGLKVCSYCQKDISSDQAGFLAPVGDKGHFKDFCTPSCMEKYEIMSNAVTPPTPCHDCAVCMKLEPVKVEVLSASRVHKLCSQPCFAAFKFVNAIVADQCDMCKKYFDKAKTENFTIFYDDAPHSFCCKTCMNVYILAKRKIVPCSWCKVKKYNFDMIKKTNTNGQVIMMCSLHCLNLYQVSASAVSARRIKCDTCGTLSLAQYHLTMSDGTMRNFCTYTCVNAFQSKFSRAAIAAGGKDDAPVPTGGPKRALNKRSVNAETETAPKGAPLPVISSVTSLAPNGEPLPAGSSIPGTLKVRAQPQPRSFSDREQVDISKMRPRKHKQWSEENMKKAILAVRGKEMGLKRASRLFSVPRSTLRGKVNSVEEDVDKLASSKLSRKALLGSELEEALVRYCLEKETKLSSITPRDMMKIAYQVSENKGLKYQFNQRDENAGRKWLSLFLRRHSMVNQKNAEETSGIGDNGFTQENVNKFFDQLEPLMEKIQHQPHKMYNCDETGLSVALQESSKVISFKGRRLEGTLSPAERASLVSLITCINATGHFVPPAIVFPRVTMESQLLDGAPNGTTAVCDSTGWIKRETFLWWFHNQFLKHVKCSKTDRVILVVDSHHFYNNRVDIGDVAKEYGVDIVCLPPHSAHKMQPLARALVYPLKIYYGQAVESWVRQNPAEMLTHYQVAKLIGEAYNRAASVSVATNGFKETGLYPFKRNIFNALEFSSEMSNHTDCEYSPQPSTSSVSPTPSIEYSGGMKRKLSDQIEITKKVKAESDSESSDVSPLVIVDSDDDDDDDDDSVDDFWE